MAVPNYSWRSSIGRAVLCGCLLLAGCQQPSPQKAQVAVQPKTPVVKNVTSFSEALRCMDDMFLAYGKQNIVITSDGIPDDTGKIKAGTKEMMISAIAKMSAKSGAYRFVDVERHGDTVFYIEDQWVGTSQITIPTYYVRGSITQADQGVMNDKQGAGLALPFLSVGASRDQLVSLVSMDLNLGDTRTRQIMPGYSSTNTIATVRREDSADVQGLIAKASLTFNLSSDTSEGSNQAVRTLVELGVIEVLGKLARVPYWRCLGIDSTNPEMMTQARDWYDQMTEPDRVRQIQAGLQRDGSYSGPIDGRMNPDLLTAVNRYQVANDLIANGRPSFDLYYAMLIKGLVTSGGSDDRGSGRPVPQPPLDRPARLTGGGEAIRLSLLPNAPEYHMGDKLLLTANTAKAVDLYCYYQSADGTVARIFPNRFRPSPSVGAGEKVTIPPGNKFSLVLDRAGAAEAVACVATAKPYGGIRPAALEETDLTPLKEGTLKDILNQHLDIDKFDSTVQVVTIKVK